MIIDNDIPMFDIKYFAIYSIIYLLPVICDIWRFYNPYISSDAGLIQNNFRHIFRCLIKSCSPSYFHGKEKETPPNHPKCVPHECALWPGTGLEINESGARICVWSPRSWRHGNQRFWAAFLGRFNRSWGSRSYVKLKTEWFEAAKWQWNRKTYKKVEVSTP